MLDRCWVGHEDGVESSPSDDERTTSVPQEVEVGEKAVVAATAEMGIEGEGEGVYRRGERWRNATQVKLAYFWECHRHWWQAWSHPF